MAEEGQDQDPRPQNRGPQAHEQRIPPSGEVTSARLPKQFIRPIGTPFRVPVTSLYSPAASLTEIAIQQPGSMPVRSVVPAADVTPELLRTLEVAAKDLPR